MFVFMSQTLTISMPDELRARAKTYAVANDRKLSDTIRVALREYLDRNESASQGRAGGRSRNVQRNDAAAART